MSRVMIAAGSSGSGKTLITCALLALFKRRGERVSALKCGPDYIDPMFHRRIAGVESGNIDPFFSDSRDLRKTAAGAERGLLVMEGVMGIYDGITGAGMRGSCYETAGETDTPIILVMDAAGIGGTIISLIKGILADDESGLIRGLILNRMSPSYFEKIRPSLEEAVKDFGVRILGAIPKTGGLDIGSRHLGLMLPGEISGIADRIDRFSGVLEASLDIGGIMEIAESAARLEIAGHSAAVSGDLKLAVAMDEAFCFVYGRNLREFRDRGVETVFFSPLRDERIPEGVSGLLLPGGYPELFLRELASNTSMISSIREAVSSGMPSLAECGGFMYLLEGIVSDDEIFDMAGIIPGTAVMKQRPVRFGYCEVEGREGIIDGLVIRGHEFHYYDTENNGRSALIRKPGAGTIHAGMHSAADHLWGFIHLYYPSCPALVDRFVDMMKSN